MKIETAQQAFDIFNKAQDIERFLNEDKLFIVNFMFPLNEDVANKIDIDIRKNLNAELARLKQELDAL